MGKRGYAAYAPEDREDAERGAPSFSLESWAQAHGVPYRGSELAGQFVTVTPTWVDYVFNVCRGELLPGRYGQVAHELEEIAADERGLDMPVGFYGVRTYGGRGLRGLIGLEKKIPNEPFATWAAWVPTTKVVLRVPEVALLPRAVIRPSGLLDGKRKLDDAGLPGFSMMESRWIDDELRQALATAARPIGRLGAAFAGVTLDHGLLAVRRNGFVDGPQIDALLDAAGRVASALVEIGAGLTAPQPFGQPLPAPDLSTWPPGFWQPQEHELDACLRAAGELGLVPEDAAAFHRALPHCPFPGTALGVARGPLGGGPEGRIAVLFQAGRTRGTYRTGICLPARAGAATPVGGQLHQPADTYVEVADGVAYAWPRVRSEGRLGAAEAVTAGLATLRALELIDG